MLDHFKALLAVAGGVVGVSGGAIALTLHQSSQYRIPTGGGNLSLASSSGSDVTLKNATLSSHEDTVIDSSVAEQSTAQSAEPIPISQNNERLNPVETIKEEEKENCEILDFEGLNDVFYYLLEGGKYVLVSCKETNKEIEKEFPYKWTGLFPEDLFSNKEKRKKFKLTAETTSSSENIPTIFSGETLIPPYITGKKGDILQPTAERGKSYLLQKITVELPKTKDIFLFLDKNAQLLRKRFVDSDFSSRIN